MMKKLCMYFVALLFIVGSAAQAIAVSSINNNFTMLDPTGALVGGTNDVVFTWDGTQLDSVAASGQISNATLSSVTPFFGVNWTAHDVAIYGPGTYTVYAGCTAGSPGCGAGTPITFTVAAGQLGVHMLFNWGASSDIDVVDIWSPNAVFGPSPMWTGAGGTGNAATVWSYMSTDWDTDGINGAGMVDGPFIGFNANFNVNVVGSLNNNFTMLDPTGALVGGTNDVVFSWNGLLNTSVAVSGQVPNATLMTTCFDPWFINFKMHDVMVYGPGTYTVYTGCAPGSPGCGTGTPITFVVGAAELGIHMLWDYETTVDVDVVNIWKPSSVFGPSPLYTGSCGSNPPNKVWDWMSADWNFDGINGYGMVDGPFPGFSANVNVMGIALPSPNGCEPADCDDGNACTTDSCDPAAGCVHTAVVCDDGNACTVDSCDPATGCVNTMINCDDNNACTSDSCDPTTGCVNSAIICLSGQFCDPASGVCCSCTTNSACNDHNECTIDTCLACGCVYTPISCDDNNPCTDDSCDPSSGSCVNTPTGGTCVGSIGNNFTMLDPNGALVGGTNDVEFTWDGTKKTAVAASGQVSNATLSSVTPFFGVNWTAHDVAIYGPGTYTVYTGCAAGSPGCGLGAPITFTVGAEELGGHMLINWSASTNLDVVDVWRPNAVFGPSPLYAGPNGGTGNPDQLWDWMSSDWNGDGVNGYPFVDGPFMGFNVSFNLMGVPPRASCEPADCDDGNACTTDSCDLAAGCVHTAVVCDDGNACTTDSCDPATGCVYSNNTLPCDDNNACTMGDVCSDGICQGVSIICNDGNACTTDTCNPTTGACVYTNMTTMTTELEIEFIEVPGAVSTEVHGINNSSVSVGTFFNPRRGFLQDAEKNFTTLAIMGTDTDAFGLNDLGDIVGLFGGLGGYHGFKLDAAGNPTIIDAPGASSTQPYDINNSGLIVGFFESPTGVHGFLRDIEGQYTILDPPGASGGGFTGTFATGINDNGEIVGKFQNISGVHGFFRDAAGNYITLDVPGDNVTEAFGINNRDEIVGFFYSLVGGISSGVHGFLRDTAGNYTILDVPGAPATRLLDINDEGKIVGSYTDASGQTHSFIVFNGTGCADADLCNGAETCQNGICTAGSAKVCNDSNVCTTDTCNPATGACTYTANTVACNDNNACTTDDVCANGTCVGTPVVCQSGYQCVGGTCVPITDCTGYPAGTACEDGNVCTINDVCKKQGKAMVCKGTTLSNGTSCEDGDICTVGDICLNGTCHGSPKHCNDGNNCTTDSCDPTTGACVHELGLQSVIILGSVESGEKTAANKQIQTQFTIDQAASPGACITSYDIGTVHVSDGAIVNFDYRYGTGPEPTSGTLDGVALTQDSVMVLRPVGNNTVHTLYLTNTAAPGGKDVDNIKIQGF